MSRARSSSSSSNGSGGGGSKIPLLLIEIVGLGLAIFLLLISESIIYKKGVPCPVGSIFSCTSILRDPSHSNLGPIIIGEHLKFPAVSIALMGVLYYVFQLLLTVFMGRRGGLMLLKMWSVIFGLLFLCYLRALEVVILGKICAWCYGVFFATILEMLFTYPLVSPPLPRLGFFKRLLSVIVLTVVFFGLMMAMVYFFRIPKKMTKADDEPEVAAEQKSETRTKPPRITPAPTPRPTPEPTKPPTQSGTTPRRSRTGTTTGTKTTKPAEGVPDNEETRALRANGWKLVSTDEAIFKYLQTTSPVMVFVYDSECGECKAFAKGELSSAEVGSLEMTRIAVEESRLETTISQQVENVPAILIIDNQGTIRYKHEGRQPLMDLLSNVAAVNY